MYWINIVLLDRLLTEQDPIHTLYLIRIKPNPIWGDHKQKFLYYWSSYQSFILFLISLYAFQYSSSHKSWIFCFAQLLLQILVNYQNKGHIWKLLVLTFSKHPLHVQFDQVLAEIFEVKDTWNQSFIFLIFDLLEMKITEIWTICSKNGSIHHQRYQYQQE